MCILNNHPEQVQSILDKYFLNNEPIEYNQCEACKKELASIGYAMEYDMDGMPTEITPIND